MRNQYASKSAIQAWALGALCLGVTGCMGSMSNHPGLEVIQKKADASKNYVEAYVEYRGPHEKWAGPTTFLLHVDAKGEMPKVTVSSPVFPGEATLQVRQPASDLKAQASPMTGEMARNQLNQLASAMQSGDVAFQGCLSPVRVRLIRVDGSVTEKQGCRGTQGWPKATSESVGRFIQVALTGA